MLSKSDERTKKGIAAKTCRAGGLAKAEGTKSANKSGNGYAAPNGDGRVCFDGGYK